MSDHCHWAEDSALIFADEIVMRPERAVFFSPRQRLGLKMNRSVLALKGQLSSELKSLHGKKPEK